MSASGEKDGGDAEESSPQARPLMTAEALRDFQSDYSYCNG